MRKCCTEASSPATELERFTRKCKRGNDTSDGGAKNYVAANARVGGAAVGFFRAISLKTIDGQSFATTVQGDRFRRTTGSVNRIPEPGCGFAAGTDDVFRRRPPRTQVLAQTTVRNGRSRR